MAIKRRSVKVGFTEYVFGTTKAESTEIKKLGSTPYGLRPGATTKEKEAYMGEWLKKRGLKSPY